MNAVAHWATICRVFACEAAQGDARGLIWDNFVDLRLLNNLDLRLLLRLFNNLELRLLNNLDLRLNDLDRLLRGTLNG